MSPFVRLFVLNFLFNCSNSAVSLLPPYLVSLGASQTYVGVYNTIGTVLILVVIVFFGRPLVKLPRMASLRVGYLCQLGAYVLSWVFADNLILLPILKVVAAIGWVFASTLLMSVLFDLTPPQKRAGSVAVFSIAGMLTNPVTTLGGEAVFRSWGGPGLFLFGAAFALATLAWSALVKEPESHPIDEAPHSFWSVVARPDLRPLMALAFAFGIYYSAITSFLPHHTQVTLGEANLSAFLVPFSVISVVLRFTLGKQFDSLAPRRFLYVSFLSILLAMVLLLLPSAWIWVLTAGLFYGVGHSILYPMLNNLFVQAGGEDQKAVYSNAYVVVNLLGSLVTTPLLGALGDGFGFSSIIVVLAAVAGASFFLVRAKFPRANAG